MHVRRSIAWVPLDNVVLAAHPRGPIIEADFDAYIQFLRTKPELLGAVVRTGDAAPSPRQRGQLIDWFDHGKRRAGIIADSVVARGAVTAMSWFGVPIRSFSPQEGAAALRFAGLSPDRVPVALDMLHRLISAVEAPQHASA